MQDLATSASASGLRAGRVPRRSTENLGVVLKALADDTRLRIFVLVSKMELCVCEIEDLLGLSQSTVSTHLAALRRAGLVESRRDAEDSRWIFYRADAAAAAALLERLAALLDIQPAPGDRQRAQRVCRLRGRL